MSKAAHGVKEFMININIHPDAIELVLSIEYIKKIIH